MAVQVTTVDLATDAGTEITAQPAKLLGLHMTTASATAAWMVKDGTSTRITMPAVVAVNTNINCYGAFFNNLKIIPSATTTGVVVVFWENV